MDSCKMKINNLPIKTKMILIIFIVNSLLFSSVAIFGLHIITQENNKRLYSAMAASLTYSAGNIQTSLQNIEQMSQLFVTDASVQQHLAALKDTTEPIARKEAYRQLTSALQTYRSRFGGTYIYYTSLYTPTLTMDTDTVRANKLPQEYRQNLLLAAGEKTGAPVWTADYSQDYGLFLSQQACRIEPMTLDDLGKLVTCVRLDKLVEGSVNVSAYYDESYYILLQGDKTLYSSPLLSEDAAKAVAKMEEGSYEVLKINGKHYFAVRGNIAAFGWQYISLVSYEETYRAILLADVLYFLVMLVCLLLSALVANVLISRITRHIALLIARMQRFGGKEATIVPTRYDYSRRNDEIGQLHREFDRMANEIVAYIQTDYTNQILMKDAHIKALEAQIDPHFLYNVLASVNWRAKAIGEEQIPAMVEALSKLLRATLSGQDDDFTLKMEMELVNNYMTIQQIRYEDLLCFTSDIPPELLNARIPKLTIQPLVENAIRYALEENDEECSVQVNACCHEEILYIYVCNSGSAFPENLLESLENNTAKAQGFGIGILNIQKRLQLCFGQEFGLSFTNRGNIAIVQMKIPYQPDTP